jgi:hypothetical protein
MRTASGIFYLNDPIGHKSLIDLAISGESHHQPG